MVQINKRKLLLEMPVVSENEVFAQSPVASVSEMVDEGDKGIEMFKCKSHSSSYLHTYT